MADIKLDIYDLKGQSQDQCIETTYRQSLAQYNNFLTIRIVGYFEGCGRGMLPQRCLCINPWNP